MIDSLNQWIPPTSKTSLLARYETRSPGQSTRCNKHLPAPSCTRRALPSNRIRRHQRCGDHPPFDSRGFVRSNIQSPLSSRSTFLSQMSADKQHGSRLQPQTVSEAKRLNFDSVPRRKFVSSFPRNECHSFIPFHSTVQIIWWNARRSGDVHSDSGTIEYQRIDE